MAGKQNQAIQRSALVEIKGLITDAAQARYHFLKLDMARSANQADHVLMAATELLVDWPTVSQDSIDSLDDRNRELWDLITQHEKEAGAV
jgi:hypothetical protein